MKYFCVSDVHGQYDKLMEALEAAHFNADTDTLINVGDPFDRGPDSLKVLRFLNHLPHKILIWGNHDHRLFELVAGLDQLEGNDITNGIDDTLKSFLNLHADSKMSEVMMLYLFGCDPNYAQVKQEFLQYCYSCCWAAEFDNLIITHAWVPTIVVDIDVFTKVKTYAIKPDWRDATIEEWYYSTWENSKDFYRHHLFPDKPLLIGHWHAFDLAIAAGEKRILTAEYPESINCGTFFDPEGKLIGIDGCTNWPYGGVVNVYQFENSAAPITYRGK